MVKVHSLLFTVSLSLVSLTAFADPLNIVGTQVRDVPPGSQVSAAFMSLKNPGERDVVLVNAHSPAADVMELHDHEDVDGVMQMRKVPNLVVPAGGAVELAPGGLHLMLIGLSAPLEEGELVEIELRFESGVSQRLEAPVRQIVVDGGWPQRDTHDQGHSHGDDH
ncbi:copper chaperone PCu(A)C [Halomonas sp. DQ26W]|uniref:copper chaperone PCu(A)C n=1 Tax=Halomonas sp. DQ26W TaxID=2282311 RepID=UPI000DF75A7E|nr:copper chaperone PCu(A)C [Halomonas sp. DQ26W]RDB41871.1 copper chaperone PCu(A)C [Halomonas sp. DQ26W]RDB42377.1 copper chaperone PCu(A)C [Halomonas sp. DQ26W]